MEQYQELIKVFNTLLTIKTCGEDTIVMAQCLSTMKHNLLQLEQLINNSQRELKENG